MNRICYIYGLIDPISNSVRYVGRTFNLRGRYNGHIKYVSPSHNHREAWINSLLDLQLIPSLQILETTVEEKANEREIFWIAKYKSEGAKLTNSTDGGSGTLNLSEESKAKIRKSRLGKTNSVETRLKISAGGKGRVVSLEVREFVGNFHRGRKRSPETIEKMRQSHKGQVAWNKGVKTGIKPWEGKCHSEETKKKMSEKTKLAWERRKLITI